VPGYVSCCAQAAVTVETVALTGKIPSKERQYRDVSLASFTTVACPPFSLSPPPLTAFS
jgi:hypothetical protein